MRASFETGYQGEYYGRGGGPPNDRGMRREKTGFAKFKFKSRKLISEKERREIDTADNKNKCEFSFSSRALTVHRHAPSQLFPPKDANQ